MLCIRGFVLKPRERAWILLKNGTSDFQISPPFERSACLYVTTTVEILNVFTTLSLKLIFWKTKTFFKKLEYHILVQSTKVESATFPHKTALPEANVKTNKMGSTKWFYQKGPSFATNYFSFLKILFQSKNLF